MHHLDQGGTCDFVADATAAFTTSSTDQKQAVMTRVEVGGEERA